MKSSIRIEHCKPLHEKKISKEKENNTRRQGATHDIDWRLVAGSWEPKKVFVQRNSWGQLSRKSFTSLSNSPWNLFRVNTAQGSWSGGGAGETEGKQSPGIRPIYVYLASVSTAKRPWCFRSVTARYGLTDWPQSRIQSRPRRCIGPWAWFIARLL